MEKLVYGVDNVDKTWRKFENQRRLEDEKRKI